MAEPYDDEEINPALLSQFEEVDPAIMAQFESPDEDVMQKRVSAYAVDPELTAEKIDELGELTNVQGLVPDAPFLQQLQQSALNAITTDPMEIADILTTQFPDTVDVRLSPEGVPVARNRKTGYQVAINKPGLSLMDFYQGLGLIGSYAPAGRFAAAPFWSVKQGLKGEAKQQAKKAATRAGIRRAVAAEGATEIGIQQAQEAAGGRMDPGEVAFTMLTAPVPELVATPLTTAGRKIYEIATENVVMDEGIRKGLEYAREHGLKVATSDALADVMTGPRQVFLRSADRVPIIGTSKLRIRQGLERGDTMEHLFTQYGLSGENNFAEYIANNFSQQSARKFADYNRMRSEAFELLANKGNVPPKKFMNLLDDEIERVAKLEPDARRRPRNWLTSVYKDFDGLESFTFRDADALLNSLMDGAAKGDALSDMKRRFADALMKDMSTYAKEVDPTAFNRWDLARSLGTKEMDKVYNQAFKEAIRTGNITPDLVDTVLNKGRGADVTTLYRNLNSTGKGLVRSRVMAQAIRRAGGSLSNLEKWSQETDNVNSLLRVLDRDPVVQKGIRRFFSDQDKEVLEGAKEYLRMTADSGKAFEAIGFLAGAASGEGAMKSGLAALNPWNWGTTTAAKVHESDFIRDKLIALRYSTDTPLKQRAIYAELRPVLLGVLQTSLQDGRDPFAAEQEPTLFERFIGGSGLAGKQMAESVGEFVEPGIDATMDYLKRVTGIGGDEEEDGGSP